MKIIQKEKMKERKEKMKYRVITFGNKKNKTYYIGKGVDILKIFRQLTIRNPKYSLYEFPFALNEDVMLIRQKTDNFYDDVQLSNDLYLMIDAAFHCGKYSMDK